MTDWSLFRLTVLAPINRRVEKPRIPKLLFRFYSEKSSGLNTPTLFRAGLFTLSPYGIPPPMETDSPLFDQLASTHLIRHEIATPFISCSPSLVWAMHMVYRISENASIAVIDGSAAHNHTRMYNGQEVIRQLRRHDKFPKNIRYLGSSEFLLWGEIPQNAIKGTLDFRSIEMLAQSSAAVNHVLRLPVLRSSRNVAEAREQFFNSQIALDDRVGIAIAKILLLFGFSPTSQIDMIVDGISHILQGWAVGIPQDNFECIRQSFRSFYLTFTDIIVGPAALVISGMESSLRDAFEKGVERAGTELLKDKPLKRSNQSVRKRHNKIVARHQNA
jgi:hypothetical protein